MGNRLAVAKGWGVCDYFGIAYIWRWSHSVSSLWWCLHKSIYEIKLHRTIYTLTHTKGEN